MRVSWDISGWDQIPAPMNAVDLNAYSIMIIIDKQNEVKQVGPYYALRNKAQNKNLFDTAFYHACREGRVFGEVF
jgi:hypothetical protein